MLRMRYDEEHAILREETRRWLESRVKSPGEVDDADGLVDALAGLGWIGLPLAEDVGGAGLGAVHLAVLFEECGRALLPGPLLSALLSASLIERASEGRSIVLPALATGELRAALALVDADGREHPRDAALARVDGRVSGVRHHVWDAVGADRLLIPVRDADTLRLAVLDTQAPGVRIEPEIVLDPTRPQARVHLDDVALADDDLLESEAGAAFEAWLPWALLAIAAEAAGGADALLGETAAYTATRRQFERAIGSFQGVKHPLVNVLIGVEHARSLVYAAATALDEGHPEAESLCRMAKAQACDSYAFAGSRAIQYHGGYGFTDECSAHRYLRRAQSLRPAFGDSAAQRAWIAADLLDPAASTPR